MQEEEKSKKEYEGIPNTEGTSWVFDPKKIYFSTVETQADIRLRHSMGLSPGERLQLMNKLNGFVFGENKGSIRGSRIIFSSYEYIPGRAS
jgi:hypothetical protein